MHLFDVGDQVEGGWPFGVDRRRRRRRAFVEVGRKGSGRYFNLPLGQSLTDIVFASGLSPQELQEYRLGKADLVPTPRASRAGTGAPALSELRLVRKRGQEDSRALVRVSIAPGVGGAIKYTSAAYETVNGTRVYGTFPPEKVRIVGEGTFEGNDVQWPIFLLQMDPYSSFRVVRTGDLEGAPAEFVVEWHPTQGLVMREVETEREFSSVRPGPLG